MRIARWTAFWLVVIGLLVVVELAEITRSFTLPITIASLSPITFVFSLVLITILALVGAVFVGFYLSSLIYRRRGFTPFEQEMLRMRQDVTALKQEIEALRPELQQLRSAPPEGGGRTTGGGPTERSP